MKKNTLLLTLILFTLNTSILKAQFFNEAKGCLTEIKDGPCLPNVILTAVPFLRIIPDARAGGMGDAGIATSSDANGIHFNASKMVFAKSDFSMSASYTPWLRNLGLSDTYLAYLGGMKKINEISSLGFALRFFSLGEIAFTNQNGDPDGTGKPRELDFSVAYSRKLSKNLSLGITGKYIYSNLAGGTQITQDIVVEVGQAFATDVSMLYQTPINIGSFKNTFSAGLAISNLGTKISYIDALDKAFLPANLGIGLAWNINLDQHNSFTLAADMNKLLVPTPIPFLDTKRYDVAPQNGKADYIEKSFMSGALESFYDASGRGPEEFREINYSIGVEYWYDQQFAVRTGYYYEDPLKGDRQYMTMGLGLRYNVFAIDMSYLISNNNNRGPLDNTLRFTLSYDFGART